VRRERREVAPLARQPPRRDGRGLRRRRLAHEALRQRDRAVALEPERPQERRALRLLGRGDGVAEVGRGELLVPEPLQRRELLESLLAGAPAPIELAEEVAGSIAQALVRARKEGWEGVVAKRGGSLYRGGSPRPISVVPGATAAIQQRERPRRRWRASRGRATCSSRCSSCPSGFRTSRRCGAGAARPRQSSLSP
jgi:hypothetical protein